MQIDPRWRILSEKPTGASLRRWPRVQRLVLSVGTSPLNCQAMLQTRASGVQKSLSVSGRASSLSDFFSAWSGGWKLLSSVTNVGERRSISYYRDPSTYLQGLVAQQGGDYSVIDSAIGLVEWLTPEKYQDMAASNLNLPNNSGAWAKGTGGAGSNSGSASNTPGGMAMRDKKIYLGEHHLYGAQRLGVRKYWAGQYYSSWDWPQNGGVAVVDTTHLNVRQPWYSGEYLESISPATVSTAQLAAGTAQTQPYTIQHSIGQTGYEWANHLGNVMAVVSDKRFEKDTDNNGSIDRYAPSLMAAYDYYPYGMLMPGRYTNDTSSQCMLVTTTVFFKIVNNSLRNLTGVVDVSQAFGWKQVLQPQTVVTKVCNSVKDGYPFGFNGQRKTNEIAGVGNWNTAEFWEYDTRTGTRLNIDPKSDVSLSPYTVFSCNPIMHSDILGDTIYRAACLDQTYMPALKLLRKTQLGKIILDAYAASPNHNVYLYAFDQEKDEESTSIYETVYHEDHASFKNGRLEEGTVEGAKGSTKFLNASGFNFNTKAQISTVGLNTTKDKHLGMDDYDKAFCIYHELSAHIKHHHSNQESAEGDKEHADFGNSAYGRGMQLWTTDNFGAPVTVVAPQSEAWQVFEQILAQKVSDKNGTAQNVRDLKYMQAQDKAAAKKK